MNCFATGTGAVWSPTFEQVEKSRLIALMRMLGVENVEALHALAVRDPERYYRALISCLRINFREEFRTLVAMDRGRPFPRWFPGAAINIVDTCLAKHDADRIAVRSIDEDGATREIDYRALREQAGWLASRLTAAGVGEGDCVGLFLPMGIEATVAFFACAWIGAIAVPAFSGYAAEALRVRLKDCDAKLLIAANGFVRRGRWIDMRQVAEEAVAGLPRLERVVLVGDGALTDAASIPWETWNEALRLGAVAGSTHPRAFDPNTPLLLMYTSGTTGRPKGIVHSHAGFLVKTSSDFALAFDVRGDDRVCWVTDLGWLVGPQMIVATTALRATAVYYTGSMDTPDLNRIWRICARENITVLGISPTAVRLMAGDSAPGCVRPTLPMLRAFVSTGEPWDATSWRWLFNEIGQRALPILNYSGGTEIAGGILTCYAALPIAECGFTGPVIGMEADVLDSHGNPITGSVGELVVRNIWPGMTHSFWGGDDTRYLETYWSEFPGIWRHGDLSQRDADGWWYICGRSDDTLKVAGRRVGPAEIETVLLQSDDVMEAAVVGIPDPIKGQVIVAFVVRRSPGLSADLLKAELRRQLGASLVPAAIHFVGALPKTRNGKVVRRAIVARYLGQTIDDSSMLENDEALLGIPQVAA